MRPDIYLTQFHVWAGRRLYALYAVFLTVDLRRGEVRGLRWRNIDLEQRTITVRGQLQWLEVELDKPRQPVWVPSPKSRAGKRVIDIWQKLADILKTWRRSQREERLILGPRWHGEDYVFTSEEGWQSARATSIAALNTLSSAPSCSRR